MISMVSQRQYKEIVRTYSQSNAFRKYNNACYRYNLE